MDANWGDFPIPEEWSDSEKKAVHNARRFFERLASPECYGSDLAVATLLGWARADSFYAICKGKQKPGLALLERIYQAGLDPSEVYPDHPYTIALQQGKKRSLALLSLQQSAVDQWLKSALAPEYFDGFVSGDTPLPARYFAVEMPDDRYKDLEGRPLSKGMVVLFDPDAEPQPGKIVLVKKPDSVLDFDIYDDVDNKNDVLAVAFSATMRATEL